MAVIFLDDHGTEHLGRFRRILETGHYTTYALEKVVLSNPRISEQPNILMADYKGDL
jgi:hypothetical protein